MIQTLEHPATLNAIKTIEATIARYGAWKVLGAAIAAILFARRRKPPPSVSDLPERLRRDIGMEGPPLVLRHWELIRHF